MGRNIKIAEVPEEERMVRQGRSMEEERKRECFRVNVDKWVCRVG